MKMNQQQSKSNKAHPQPPEKASPGSGRMIAAMGTVGLIAALLIVFTYQVTFPYIQQNKARFLEQAIFEVVPGAVTKTAYRVDENGNLLPVQSDKEKAFLYACYNETGDLAGVAVEASGQGFQDVVRIIYGYDPQKQAVVGMKVLESTETPGLGDKIEKDPQFLANFDRLDVQLSDAGTGLAHAVELVKSGQKTEDWQISAITGATISSRAITKMLRESTEKNIPFIQKHLAELEGGN